MRKSRWLLLLLVLAGATSARAADTLMPFNKKGKWGFIARDAKRIEFALLPAYELAYPFHEGRAAVRMNGKWGFINEKGTLVIPCQYEDLDNYEFRRGVAVVKKGYLRGVIDRDGKEILPAKFMDVYIGLDADVIVATMANPAEPNAVEGLNGLYDLTGKQLLKHEYSHIFPYFTNGVSVLEKNNRQALVNSKGELLSKLEFQNILFIDIDHFIGVYPDNKGQVHYDAQGRLLFKSDYPYVGRLSDNRAVFSDKTTKKRGYLNEKGEVAIPATYFLAESFKDGVAFVQPKLGGGLELIDTTGKSLGAVPNGDLSYGFTNGLAWVRDRTDHSYYCYDRQLNKPFPGGFDSVRSFDENGLAVVSAGRDQIGLIDKQGDFVLKPEYYSIRASKVKGQYLVVKGEATSVIDKTGKQMLQPQTVNMKDYDDMFYKISPNGALHGEYFCMARNDGILYYDNRPN